jgi:hypothetical protein
MEAILFAMAGPLSVTEARSSAVVGALFVMAADLLNLHQKMTYLTR